MEFASKMDDPDPALRQIEKLERERKLLLDEARRLVQENEAAEAMKDITENDVRKLLQSIADDTQRMDREALKDLLSSGVDRMELDPGDWTCQIRYRIGIEGRNKVASPTGLQICCTYRSRSGPGSREGPGQNISRRPLTSCRRGALSGPCIVLTAKAPRASQGPTRRIAC